MDKAQASKEIDSLIMQADAIRADSSKSDTEKDRLLEEVNVKIASLKKVCGDRVLKGISNIGG